MKTNNSIEVILENSIQAINIENTSRNTIRKTIKGVQRILNLSCNLFRDRDEVPYAPKTNMSKYNSTAFIIVEGNIIFYGQEANKN